MVKDDIKHYSQSGIKTLKAKGKVKATPKDAPEIELSEAFWKHARIAEARPRHKASVHLRLDPEVLAFYRAAGRGHLTRMANILKVYAQTQVQSKQSSAK